MPVKIEHRTGIAASADRVWDVFSNLGAWHGWNPAFSEAEGTLAFGAPLILTETLPHQPGRKVETRVVSWTPRELLHLEAKVSFLTSATYFFEIDELTETGCIFAGGIMLRGWGEKAAARKLGRSYKLGFGLMGEALKAKVEKP